MFNFVKDKIKKVYAAVTGKMAGIFGGAHIDEAFFKQLQVLLLEADTGVKTTTGIMEQLTMLVKERGITSMEAVRTVLAEILEQRLGTGAPISMPPVIMMVGVNGSGKTTFVAKLASLLHADGKRVLLVAGDTFRAAATQQLAEWGRRSGTEVFIGKEEQDPASVIFDACARFKQGGFDHLVIDTAGRLQTKVNLMHELVKVRKVISRQLPDVAVATWLGIDAMLGQNSLRQAEVFNEATKLDGVILTKLDGTGKGGIVFAITDTLKLPIVYITFGEEITAIKPFDSKEYVRGLLFE